MLNINKLPNLLSEDSFDQVVLLCLGIVIIGEPSVGLMLVHHLRRWFNIKPTLDRRSLLADNRSEWVCLTLTVRL